MSVGARASLLEVQQSISTWPQLASAIMLGSAVATNAARRILLGSLTTSGRFRIDLDALVADGKAEETGKANTFAVEASVESQRPPAALEAPIGTGPIGPAELEYLVGHGIMAPSGGNTQPWRFVGRGAQLECWLALPKERTYLDVDGLASFLAIGAAIENIELAAREIGLAANIDVLPTSSEPSLAATIAFERGETVPSPLFERIRSRVSNRRKGVREPVPAGFLDAVREHAADLGAVVRLVDEPGALRELGEIIGACDRMRMLSHEMRHELLSELRWSPEEASSTRDGIELATLELSPLDHAALSILSSDEVVSRLVEIEGGGAMVSGGIEHLESASAALLIAHPESSPRGYLAGGRALQRIWLEANARGLAVHPHGVAGFLFERIERGGLGEVQRGQLEVLRQRYDELFSVADVGRIMVLRLAKADAPSARSFRRPVSDVLSFANE